MRTAGLLLKLKLTDSRSRSLLWVVCIATLLSILTQMIRAWAPPKRRGPYSAFGKIDGFDIVMS